MGTGTFVCRHYLFQEANFVAHSFPQASLLENCELRGTDNVQGQISMHIFKPNGGYCAYYPSNIFTQGPLFLGDLCQAVKRQNNYGSVQKYC